MAGSPFKTLAALLSYPNRDTLALLADVRDAHPKLQRWTSERADHDGLEALQQEYTRLFISDVPSVAAPPYESAYVQTDRESSSHPCDRLLAWYRSRAVDLRADYAEPADYLPVELEFSAVLEQRQERDALRRFLSEHLGRWLPSLWSKVVDHERLPVYAALLEMAVELTDHYASAPAHQEND